MYNLMNGKLFDNLIYFLRDKFCSELIILKSSAEIVFLIEEQAA